MFSEEQFKIDSAIVDAVAASLPRKCRSARLIAERESAAGELIHRIETPAGELTLTDSSSLGAAIHELDEYLKSKGIRLRRAIYNIDSFGQDSRWSTQYERFQD